MKIKFDSEADAAYIYLADEIRAGGVARTYLCDPVEVRGMINLDFVANGRLIGIEIMDASRMLTEDVLDEAKC
ncbi:DUF2283 domain-containing protein [Arthrobacter sp. NyZ413]|uniref:DUF2283 domain-containing protein n=1 Tax=Arthrobacter sp. NyZ413 TaxID=3144669 RepID=UPI003BF9132D